MPDVVDPIICRTIDLSAPFLDLSQIDDGEEQLDAHDESDQISHEEREDVHVTCPFVSVLRCTLACVRPDQLLDPNA